MSVFAGATVTQTGLHQGVNHGVTAALDLNLPEIGRIRPSLEVRANAPYQRGDVDDMRSILGGPRVEFRFDPLRPYVDVLLGRGGISFTQPYPRVDSPPLLSQPDTTVVSPGFGARYNLTAHLSLFGDAQLQRWGTPASLSGHLFAKPLSGGLSYRFGLTSHKLH